MGIFVTLTSLKDFLLFLNHQTKEKFQNGVVDHFLTTKYIASAELKNFSHFRGDTYGRNLIAKNDFYELILLTWLPKQRTPIHDHGGQRCWMYIQEGELSFKNYAPLRESNELIPTSSAEMHHEGNSVYIDDGIGVHSICNNSIKPAASLHLYAGPVPRCRIYNESKQHFEWVNLDYHSRFGEILKTSDL